MLLLLLSSINEEAAIIFHSSTLIGIYKYLIISRVCKSERDDNKFKKFEILNITNQQLNAVFVLHVCAYRKIFIFICIWIILKKYIYWVYGCVVKKEKKKFTDEISFLHSCFSLLWNVLRVRSKPPFISEYLSVRKKFSQKKFSLDIKFKNY